MKISGTSNNSFQNKVLIDTFIEQISALQTDVGNLQIADDNLAQALATKANTADINTAVNTGTLTSTNGNIKTLNVQGTGSSATIENATIGTASIGTETVTQSNITNLEVADVDAGTVRTGTITVENDATISGNVAVQDVSAKDITSASVNTLNITTAEADINKLKAQNAEVTGKLEVNDLEVNGTFSGVSNIETESIEAESVTADTAEIETLDVKNIRSWVTQVMNQDQILNPPTPALGNADTYTIELPRFDGVFLLSWEDADVVWSATVIGNGKSYGISWGSRTDQNYITDLFQYNGKLYIRVNSNGKLKYAYSTTKEPDQIVIYRNMNGWTPDKSLEELCDELSHIQNVYFAGTAWLGPVYIPRLLESDKSIGAFNFKGSCTFSDIPDFVDVLPGDVWNITDESYTDGRFVEGAGKPINAGDDIIAVIIEENDNLVIKWDKFAAGINYDNFVTDNITATSISATSIKKNNSEVLTEADRTNTVTENSTDVLTSGGAYTALATKQDTLTFDNVPTENSDNPVKSGGVYSALNTKIDNSEKGAANGVATLDATGRVPYNQLPESAMEYKGTWDASTNTPTLADGTGTNGDFYVVSVAGTVTFSAGRSITFYVNDRVIYDGTLHEWERLPAGEVRSVNGQTGDVTLSIPAAQVNSDWNASSGVAQILNKPALATVATSGSYSDLSNKPTIPTVVDTVADGNMNAVTSNAVYDYIDAAITQVLNTGF